MEAHWIVLLVAVIPFWLLQNVIHELSHGLTLRLGWNWDFKIWPFPSTALGRFTFAHVKYMKNSESTDPPEAGWALVSIMPRIVNIVFILISAFFLAVFSNMVVSILFLLFMWTNLIDFCVGMLSSLREPNKSDIWKFQSYLGIPKDYLRYTCVGMTIYQGAFVIVATLLKLL